jgi:hypothetical protein
MKVRQLLYLNDRETCGCRLSQARARDRLTHIKFAVAPDKVEAVSSNSGKNEHKDSDRDNAGLGIAFGKQTNENNEDAESEEIRNGLDEDRTPVNEDWAGADIGSARLVGAQEEIIGVLSRAVAKVVKVVSRHANATILQSAELCTLAQSGDIGLHGTGA